jgi:RNA polymerase sigma-70 factor (ECF subfamily)
VNGAANVDDEELMHLAKAGSQTAFATIVDKYSNPLLNFFLRKGVSYSDGQDLAQRTFLRLWNYRGKYEPKAKFTTFLFMIATQISIDYFRTEASRKNLEEKVKKHREIESGSSNGDKVDERGEMVRKAVSELSDGLRSVVELGVFQEMKYSEVSEILNIPEGTVKSRMFTAVKKLKEILHGYGF